MNIHIGACVRLDDNAMVVSTLRSIGHLEDR